jgi:hypothetical protein
MADKKIKLSVAGQEVVCNFGVNYFYKHFYEITGVDMLVDGLKGIETTKMFEVVPHIYFAGYKAECSVSKTDSQLNKDDFEHHVLSMDEAGATNLIKDYLNAINPKEETKQGEEQAQTVSP